MVKPGGATLRYAVAFITAYLATRTLLDIALPNPDSIPLPLKVIPSGGIAMLLANWQINHDGNGNGS